VYWFLSLLSIPHDKRRNKKTPHQNSLEKRVALVGVLLRRGISCR
jgi:hypothetical protein